MKQQTAVEWLVKQYEKAYTLKINNVMTSIIEQAKAMEKEQIEDAYKDGWNAGDYGSDCWEEIYYNENFKSE